MKLSCIYFGILVFVANLRADVTVHPLFSDHAVLQKSAKVPIWGWADPGEKVRVSIDGTTAETQADTAGKWRLDLNLADKPQGPFSLVVEEKNTLTIRDVVIGEVWVCSGQSNMEMVLAHTLGAKEEIANSANPLLRHFAIAKNASTNPQEKVSGRWVVADPATSGGFTAVGYWFGKMLTKTLNAPVGLIHASWGGTPSEGWTSATSIDTDPHLKSRREELFDLIQKAPGLKETYPRRVAEWISFHQRHDQSLNNVPDYTSGPTDGWTAVKLPGKLIGPGLPSSGVIWVRREVEVPKAAEGKNAKLEFVLPDAFDSVYWNGKKIREYSLAEYPGIGRTVTIPASEIRAGKASLAIRVYAPSATAEFTGDSNRIRLFEKPLGGTWLAKAEQNFADLENDTAESAPEMPKDPPPQFAPAGLFNGMIAPLIPYAIRGAIWYQGENNVSRAFAYRKAFPLLITDWRSQWKQGEFPFYFCQLANFEGKWKNPGDSAWAELREAQAMTRRLPNTGMAVLIDLGETKDIHPRNKKDVGERLAAIALARDYGKDIPYAGPTFDSLTIDGSKATVRFKNVGGGLIAKPLPTEELYRLSPKETGPLFIALPDSELQGFVICGEDRKWKWAKAEIDGDSVVLSSEEVPEPVAVRYAWANNPTCNLYNQAGFPAEPFRTDDFPAITANGKF
jgi:sialate O-acetylesterase